MVEDSGTLPARRVVVVAEPNRESAGALQYALSHVVVENDTLILLYVENPNNNAWRILPMFRRPSINVSTTASSSSSTATDTAFGSAGGGGGGGASEAGGGIDFIEAMKHACGLANDKIKVQIEKVEMIEGKDKAAVILARCAALDVEVIIVGQKTNFSNAILGARRSRSLRGMDTAEYLIENSKCTCVGVQRKATGGFILNSKTHKNFWLLA